MVKKVFNEKLGYGLESDSGRYYDVAYGHGIGANTCNDIVYIMDMNTETGEMVCWFWGASDFGDMQDSELEVICGLDIRNHEQSLKESELL